MTNSLAILHCGMTTVMKDVVDIKVKTSNTSVSAVLQSQPMAFMHVVAPVSMEINVAGSPTIASNAKSVNKTKVYSTSIAAISEEMPKKAHRAESFSSANLSTSVSSNAFVALQSSSSINMSEFELALKALPMKVRVRTATIYRMPLELWKYPYTVGPTEFVIIFFKEFVFKRTYMKIAENAPSNKNGSQKVIEAPLEAGWPSPKKTKEVIELIKKYEHNLVYDQVQTNVDRAAHFVIRNSYKSGKLIRILKSLWTSDSKSGLHEMFSISFCHHMLLRNQDWRNLNFVDCFCTIIPKKQHKGMQQALALVFSLDKGKSLKEGEVKFACVMRHENIFRYPFGAFAFFMFSLLQTSGDFLNKNRWQNWKVLRRRTSPEKSLTGTSQWKTAKKTFADDEIYTT
ncbi:hypothetical protein PHYBLDRAFT_142364 [Phycomyces blakesleeanus NRRL 1555(-)]|uniref:Ndc10 domain-containing protein n=1 Tax=Phycomyces blakesleeanus (strain ATCC 8743b / DSM 1359 / FGSC 10004 / NBRC 33097 / NRRL 1555) TaxID=763407 RepID=A0A167NY11_PHYB8|nr:hypothetical protein PHYBLDRAFT_142364 [Phycomyces blakesleeanus NRRL 1555(-)]OAD76858.1 hypothetical protein PHYBLDRAFT_142364 [Phycomyces blakesleeanus NRRL 1555(-)]|eukprot:XP_018294898.1 hypothetical protein PHYBLDRAFT_142364 [Phycomyces blakesleeanus NRRL 1555(-)]